MTVFFFSYLAHFGNEMNLIGGLTLVIFKIKNCIEFCFLSTVDNQPAVVWQYWRRANSVGGGRQGFYWILPI